MNKNTVKIVISVVFLLAASALIAYSLGLFSGGSSRPAGGTTAGVDYEDDAIGEDAGGDIVDPETGKTVVRGQSGAFTPPGPRR